MWKAAGTIVCVLEIKIVVWILVIFFMHAYLWVWNYFSILTTIFQVNLDLWILELVCNITHGTSFLPISVLLRLPCRVMGNVSNWRRDMYSLRSPRLSWYSARVSSLKFVDLPVTKILLTFGHGVKLPGDLDLSVESRVTASLLPIFRLLRPSVLDWESGMDRQWSSMHNAPALWGRGKIYTCRCFVTY